MSWESLSVLEMLVADLGLDPDKALFVQEPSPASGPGAAAVVVDGDLLGRGASRPGLVASLADLAEFRLAEGGCLLIYRSGPMDVAPFCALRNACWPHFHIPIYYQLQADRPPVRWELSGKKPVDCQALAKEEAHVIVAVRGVDAFRPDAVIRKFDHNASGWNGEPGAPSYGHFRWMRRIMAEMAGPQPGQRVLDAGCGAGWVGIEAALRGAQVSSFDPSPEMVRIAEKNARDQQLEIDFKVGFTEAPPFSEPFDMVISAGVVSFSPDQEQFMNGLDSQLKVGGTLVIADLNHRSWGMGFRRAKRPLLPSRELNALTRPGVIELLRKRGYRIESKGFYQLTLPVPYLMHLSETRLGGLGSFSLLLCNRTAHWLDSHSGSFCSGLFDSFMIRARKVGGPVPQGPAGSKS